MKKVKFLAMVFVLSLVVATVGVQADGYLGIIGVKLPKNQGTYTTATQGKSTDSLQYVKMNGSSPSRAVRARVLAGSGADMGAYHTLAKNRCESVTGTDGVGFFKGSWKLRLQTVASYTSATEFTGNWILEEHLKSAIC